MPGGLATIGKHKCVVIGHQKGRDTKERAARKKMRRESRKALDVGDGKPARKLAKNEALSQEAIAKRKEKFQLKKARRMASKA